MNWLAQNWVWIALGIGVLWLFSRAGLAGCGMGAHGSHGKHGDTESRSGGTSDTGESPSRDQVLTAGATPAKALDNTAPETQQHGRHGCC